MGRIANFARALMLTCALAAPTGRLTAQTPPPNLYTWLRNNSHPAYGPTSNWAWYWGCAAGLSGACQYVALGPIRSEYPVMSISYNTMTIMPNGFTYYLYDMWAWTSPSEECSGADDKMYVPKTCLPYLPKMKWRTRVEWYERGQMRTTLATFHHVSGATVTPEPSTLALVGSGLAGLSGVARWGRRRRLRKASGAGEAVPADA